MTKNITEIIHSTTTVQEPHSSPKPAHESPKPIIVTSMIKTTVVATVTAHNPTKSHCEEKTITKTKTVTKHESKQHESSQSLIMISQLSDGQINGPPVTIVPTNSTMPHAPAGHPSLSLHGPPPKVSASRSAIVNPLQSSPFPTYIPSSVGPPRHGHETGSTTCTESKGLHDGIETRNPDAPVPFPTQSFFNVTSVMGHSKGPKPVHERTLSVWYSQTKAAET